MSELFLEAIPRSGTRKGAARKMRMGGRTPGIIYGLNEPAMVSVDTHTLYLLAQHLHGGERMVSLRMDDGKGKVEEKNVLIKDVQMEAVGNHPIHVDFQEIDLTKKVQVNVEVRGVGQSAGVRLGGILQSVRHEILIECLPTTIPEYIDADITALNMGDSFHVSDLQLPEGIRVLTSTEETLFVVSVPRTAEEEAAAEGAEEPTTVPTEAKAEEESE